MHKNLLLLPLLLCAASTLSAAAGSDRIDYRLLATTKTSSMEREMNEAAASGYVFSSLMGGETAFGGKETVVIMARTSDGGPTRAYKLLATNKTSTMEKELNDAGRDGFAYRGTTIFESAFGGREVAVILERVPDARSWEFRVLATSKTATMEKELREAGAEGFVLQGMCVAKTAFGGNEVLSVLSRPGGR